MVASTNTGPSTLGNTWRRMTRQGGTPITRAACTYSFCRSTRVEPRTVRAYCTQPVREIDNTNTPNARVSCALGNSARPTPAINKATSMAGKDNITSHNRIKTASTQPPQKPANKPRKTPTRTDKATDAKPTAKEMRAPYINADKMSRPWSSVPNQKPACPPSVHAGGKRAFINPK